MTRNGVVLIVPIFVCTTSLADDKSPPKVVVRSADHKSPPKGVIKSFEDVLSEKGLKRHGQSYILKDTEARDAKLRVFDEELGELNDRFRPLLQTRAHLKQRLDEAEASKENNESEVERRIEEADKRYKELEEQKAGLFDRGIAKGQLDGTKRVLAMLQEAVTSAEKTLSVFESQHREDFNRYEAETHRIKKASIKLVNETKQIYSTLAADPEVKKAIRTHNRERRPKVVLGPFYSPEEYLACIRNDDFDLLRERGIVFDQKQRKFMVAAERELVFLVRQVHGILKKLDDADRPIRVAGQTKYESLMDKRKSLLKLPPTATATDIRRRDAALKVVDDQIKRLPPGASDPIAGARERDAKAERTRSEFFVAMRDLRKTAAEAPQIRQLAEANREVADAILELVGNSGVKSAGARLAKIAEPLEYRRGLASLMDFEKRIRLERIPLGAELDGMPTISAALDGGHSARMVIDPDTKTTILPARLATLVGAMPGADSKTVFVDRGDGVKVNARESVLGSLRLGSIKLDSFACLVLPADAPLEPPPVLGKDALDRFGADVVPGEGLVLMELVTTAKKVASGQKAE